MKRLCVILPVLGIPDVIGNTVLSKPPASGGETRVKYSRIALDMVTLKDLVISDHARANGVH